MDKIVKAALDNTFGSHQLYKINGKIYVKIEDYYVYLNKYSLITERNNDKETYKLIILNPTFFENRNNYDLLIDESDYKIISI